MRTATRVVCSSHYIRSALLLFKLFDSPEQATPRNIIKKIQRVGTQQSALTQTYFVQIMVYFLLFFARSSMVIIELSLLFLRTDTKWPDPNKPCKISVCIMKGDRKDSSKILDCFLFNDQH